MRNITIKQIDLHSVILRFVEPLRTVYGTSFETENIVVRIFTDDNLVGLGEASPSLVTKESVETIVRCFDKLAPTLKNADDLKIDVVVEEMDEIVSGNPSAKAAIDIALHDILGQRMKKPLFALFGDYHEVQTDITLSSGTPAQMAQDSNKAIMAGFKALKIKVAFSSKYDFERIKTVRNSVGPDISLRLDANQGWSACQAIKMLKKLEPFNLDFVEQPVKARDLKGLRKVRKSSEIPVMADESVCSPEDAINVLESDAADMINIKLMKCGGLLKAKEIAEIAQTANVPCMCGCMVESNIGITAAVHLSSAVTNIKFADLDSDILLKDKLVLEGGADLKDSQRIPPSGSGLGIVKLDEKFLTQPIRKYVF